MADHLHQGHRDRLRNEFLSHTDSSAIPEHKLLEMLLFYGIPRQDTNPLAHTLINTFGSFSAVFEADVTDLAAVKGMTKNAAVLIKLMLPIAKAYIKNKSNESAPLKTREEIGNFILTEYFGVSVERCSLLCLNHTGKVLSFDILAEGSIDSVGISIRSVIERVVQTGATSVVLAHNHPGGIALPSPADVSMTVALSNALKAVSVNFCDHIIISDNDYISMALSSEYKELFS